MTLPSEPKSIAPVDCTVGGLLHLLQAEAIITRKQSDDARKLAPVTAEELKRAAKRAGGRQASHQPSPGEILARMGMRDPEGDVINENRIAECFANAAGFRYVKLDPLKLDSSLVTETLSLPFALRNSVLPIALDPERIIIATDDPYAIETLEQIRNITQRKVEVWISSRSDILRILKDLYGFRTSVAQAANEVIAAPDLQNLEALVHLKSGSEIEASDTHVVNAVEYLLRYGFEQKASDIHIEPRRLETDVRMRIDGVLHNVYTIPRQIHPPVVSRIKSMGRLDIAEKRRPQDGRIKTEYNNCEVELRISTLPVAFGEKVVIRIFDPQVLVRQITELGFFRDQLEIFRKFIHRPHGMILVTGPTGSGKTTTLYSALREIATAEVNVTTIEDPIEMVVEDFNQVSVNPRADLDFANALRTILRQDPDVLMVGEIRDGETARMAIQAALTGHLVISTVHTNDAPGAITRLQDLGVPSYLISSTLIGVIAQRLVRKNCNRCKARTYLTDSQCMALSIPMENGQPPKLPIWEGSGCHHCRETGFSGRDGVIEIMTLNEELREMICAGTSTLQDLRRAAIDAGMQSLRESAIKKLAKGVTSFDEVLRVTASGDV